MDIDHANQAWSIDLTYIPMKKGFMYPTAIIDIYSRYIVGWGLHNSLDASNSIEVLQSAVRRYGKS
jgi:putative transposase